jgi:hypothetical protein
MKTFHIYAHRSRVSKRLKIGFLVAGLPVRQLVDAGKELWGLAALWFAGDALRI